MSMLQLINPSLCYLLSFALTMPPNCKQLGPCYSLMLSIAYPWFAFIVR